MHALLWRWPGRSVRHALGLVWLLGFLPAWAGGLSVLPTRLDLGASKGLQSVLITNTSAQIVTVETQVLVWPEGAAGQQANDVVVTPAVLTLPPNQRMRVRVGLLRPEGGDVERAYRLYFTELAAPSPLQGAGIGVRLRVGIPVFAAPAQPRPQPLQWSAQQGAEGWLLNVRNVGNVHARTARLTLLGGAEGPRRFELPGNYMLANSSLTMALPGAVAPGARVRWLDGDDERESALVLP